MLVLSVSSLKGGVGKTSVTLGLASAALSRGIPTLVVDMDPQADASTGLDVPVNTPADIADVLAAPKSKLVKQAITPSGWVEGKHGVLDVIPGSPRAAEFDRPSLSDRYLKRLREAISRNGSKYRLVLIDCPPSLNGLTRAAWTASQRVLIVTEPGLFSVAAADRALRATDELRRRSAAKLQPLGIVVNRVRPSSREQSFRIQELKDMFGPLVLNPPLSERTVLQQAQGSARPIHEWPGKPASELASAFDSILDRALRSKNMRGRGSSVDNSVKTPAKPTEKPKKPAEAPKNPGKTEKNPAQVEEKSTPMQANKAKKKSSEPTQASDHNANTSSFDAMLSRKVESMKQNKDHKPKH
ncbi:AAA family ATPase [Brevibacterium mcbrellneri]